MPSIVIPNVFLTNGSYDIGATVVAVEQRVVRDIEEELFRRYPILATRYQYGDGRPSLDWFGLFRDEDHWDLRSDPETVVGENDRLHAVNLIGC